MSVTDKIVEIRMIEKYEVKNILCVYDVDKKNCFPVYNIDFSGLEAFRFFKVAFLMKLDQ